MIQKNKIIIYLLCILLLTCAVSFGQNNISFEDDYKLNVKKKIKVDDFQALNDYTSDFKNRLDNFNELKKYNALFLALSQVNLNQINYAEKSLDSLLQVTNNEKYNNLIKGIYGISKYRQGDFESCLEYLGKPIDYLSVIKDKNDFDNYFLALFLRFLGRTYSETGISLQAISMLQKSNQIFENLGFIENTYINYKFIGRAYIQSDINNDSLKVFALYNYNFALQGFKKYNMRDEIPWIYTIIADYYLAEKNYKQAKLYQDSAYNMLKEDEILLRGLSHNNFGKIYEIKNDFVNAKKYYLKAIKDYELINNNTNRAVTYYNLSGLFLKKKLFNQASAYADSSILYSVKSQNLDKTGKVYLLISDIYKEKLDYKNAYYYFYKSHQLSHQLSEQQSKDIAFSYRAIYKTKQKEKENLKLKSESELKDLKMYSYRVYALIFIAFLTLLFVSIFFRIKRTKQINAAIFRLKGQEDEKQRLSRELHDGIGSNLKGIALKINHLAENNNLENNVSEVVKNITDVNDELRRISHDLALPFKQSLDENIRRLIKRITAHNEISVFYNSFPASGWETVDYKISFELYRIVQEAINNIIEHSDSESAEIQLTRSKDEILLTISDNGKGFDIEKKQVSGIGMINIHSRVKVLNGKISITSEPDGGTFIEISIPR
ncbi:MAG: sensor histidine kinase [Bacteroidales bacterium]|nr:sensor histidine kinase [Bacteroidales bacterium]